MCSQYVTYGNNVASHTIQKVMNMVKHDHYTMYILLQMVTTDKEDVIYHSLCVQQYIVQLPETMFNMS